jgi:hypothetical protein
MANSLIPREIGQVQYVGHRKAPKSSVTSLPLRRMRRALIQGFRLRAKPFLTQSGLKPNVCAL